MKKILIALGVAASAVAVQAASFSWTTTAQAYGIATATLSSLVDGTHYSVGTGNTDRMKTQSSNNGIVWSYTMTLSDGTSTDTLTGSITGYSSNKIKVDLTSDVFTLPATDATKLNLAYSIVITGSYKDANDTEWTLTSDAITGSDEYSNLSAAVLATAAPGGWTAVAPEPTSGLMLLLGVAGLALKRKRA